MGVYRRVPACTGVHLRVPVFLLLRNEQGTLLVPSREARRRGIPDSLFLPTEN